MDNLVTIENVKSVILNIRNQSVILDADVARLYGVETRAVNQAVKNNPDKFPEGFVLQLDNNEFQILQSKFLITNISSKSRVLPKAFTERGLYMLATILKSPIATQTTIAIVNTFAQVRELRHDLIELHREDINEIEKSPKIKKFGEILADLVMPDLETSETESSLEINFFIGKLKHKVKRVETNNKGD